MVHGQSVGRSIRGVTATADGPGAVAPRPMRWARRPVLGHAAIRPATSEDVSPVTLEVSAGAKSTFLATFPRFCCPANTPCWSSTRVWLYLRERILPHRVLDGHGAIAEAGRPAWNALTPERLGSSHSNPGSRRLLHERGDNTLNHIFNGYTGNQASADRGMLGLCRSMRR